MVYKPSSVQSIRLPRDIKQSCSHLNCSVAQRVEISNLLPSDRSVDYFLLFLFFNQCIDSVLISSRAEQDSSASFSIMQCNIKEAQEN